MTKRIIEMDDNLQEIVDSTIEEVKEALLEYLEENPDTDDTPDMGNDLDYSGRIHEIIDGAVPVYTKEIDDIFYLHGDKVEQAFEDAGIGEKKDGPGWPSGWKAVAIYCYIEQQVNEWYHKNANDVFEEWQEKQANADTTKSE